MGGTEYAECAAITECTEFTEGPVSLLLDFGSECTEGPVSLLLDFCNIAARCSDSSILFAPTSWTSAMLDILWNLSNHSTWPPNISSKLGGKVASSETRGATIAKKSSQCKRGLASNMSRRRL